MGSVNEPTLEDVLLEVLDSRLADVHTALPGRVESYDAAKQTANVSLMIQRVDRSESGKLKQSDYPVLANVPIAFPRGGGCFVSFPLAKGDFVFVVFAESAIDQWRAKGSKTYPGDLRKHSLTGAVALPCLYPKGSPLESASDSAMALGQDGGTLIEIDEDEIRLGSSGAVSPVALSPLVETDLNTLKSAIAGAAVVAGDGGAAFKAAIGLALAAWPSSLGASKVKAE